MQRISSVSAVLIVAWFVGCGDTSEPGGGAPPGPDATTEGGGNGIPLEELPEHYARGYCAVADACWGDVLDVLLAGEDCLATTEAALSDQLGRIEQAIADGSVVYDGTKLEACLDAIVARGCNSGLEPAECTAAIDGTVQIGAACSMNAECAGADTYCKTSEGCPGTCARREVAGSACASDSDCAAGLACSEQTQRCVEPAAAGDRCGGGIEPDCEPGLICLGEDEAQQQAGNCRSIQEAFSGQLGETCLLQGAPFCDPALRCVIDSVNTTTGEAVTRCSAPVSSGSACKLSFPDVCPFDQYCAVPAASLDGVCTPKPAAGQPCAARGDDEANICAPNTRCDGGICRSLQGLGGTCQTNEVCYSDTCRGGACVAAGSCE